MARPVTIARSFTQFEDLQFNAIRQFANDPANTQWENLRCLDADGTRLIDMSLGVGEGPITDKMRDRIGRGQAVRFWHNHPSADSLSPADWRCASLSPNLEILAFNSHGSIFVGRISVWSDRLGSFFSSLSDVIEPLYFELDRSAKGHHLNYLLVSDLDNFTGHVLNLALADCTVVDYAYEFGPRDQNVIDACSVVIDKGRSYACFLIRKMLVEA